MEEWMPLYGLEGLYEINIHGCPRNCRTLKTIKAFPNKKGYFKFTIKIKGRQYHRYVHRSLGMAYIPNPNNLPQIDHINRIKSDNRIENLRWVNNSQNNLNRSNNRPDGPIIKTNRTIDTGFNGSRFRKTQLRSQNFKVKFSDSYRDAISHW